MVVVGGKEGDDLEESRWEEEEKSVSGWEEEEGRGLEAVAKT